MTIPDNGPSDPEERRLWKQKMYAVHYGMSKERLAELMAEWDRIARRNRWRRRLKWVTGILTAIGTGFLLWSFFHGLQ
jgi:hypothetical protein